MIEFRSSQGRVEHCVAVVHEQNQISLCQFEQEVETFKICGFILLRIPERPKSKPGFYCSYMHWMVTYPSGIWPTPFIMSANREVTFDPVLLKI